MQCLLVRKDKSRVEKHETLPRLLACSVDAIGSLRELRDTYGGYVASFGMLTVVGF